MTSYELRQAAKLAYEIHNQEYPDVYPFDKQTPEHIMKWMGLVFTLFRNAEIHRMFMDQYQAHWDYQI